MENPELQIKPRKNRAGRFFLWFFIVLIAIAGGVWAYFHFSDSGQRDPFSVLPDDAVYVIETSNLTKGWSALSDSKVWKTLMGNKMFEEINASALSLDSIIKGNNTLDMLFSDRRLLISAHMISLADYDFIFAVDLKKASKITFVKDYIADIAPAFGYTMSKRNFKESEIIMLTDKETGEVLHLTFIDNILVCSYTAVLVEKAIQQKENFYWDRNTNFKLITGEISSRKLFNFYLNYSLINTFMRCYLSESSDALKSMGKALSYSAFNVMIEDELLSFSGYTGVNDSVPSYFSALLGVPPGGIRAHTVISEKAALYISISFDDFNAFFDNLKNQFDAEDTTRAKNYNKTISKVEKYLKVDLETDFFGWIGKEIALVKMEPVSNAREEDVVVTIHAGDIEAAKAGLDRITSQIRKKTISLAKFKEEEYKGFTIKYLGFSGFLRLFFGKLFNTIEKPYFTYINDFVVFSNSPSCLMDVIDDHLAGTTLDRNEKFMDFVSRFEKESNVSTYVQMPKIYSHMYYYSRNEKRKGIRDNKDLIVAFNRIGFQMISEKDKFKTTLIATFDEDAAFNEELENIESAAEDLFVNEADSSYLLIVFPEGYRPADGPLRIMHDDSLLAKYEGRIVNGKPDGLWRIYHPGGKIAGMVTYSDGKANGESLYYFDSDKQITRCQITYRDDMIDGMYREFYQNGQRKASIEYAEGVPDGDAEFFYDSGMIKMEGQYRNGEKTGKWKHYTELGDVMDKEKWKKGIKKNRQK